MMGELRRKNASNTLTLPSTHPAHQPPSCPTTMAQARRLNIQSSHANTFLVFFDPRLEHEWLDWSKETLRRMEFWGAAASTTVAVLVLLGVFCNGVLSKSVLAAFGADILVSAGVLMAPFFVGGYDPWIRTRVSILLRMAYVPLLSWVLLTSLDLTPLVGSKASRFLTFFFPLHLLLGTLRFPLRYREHVVAQLAAAAVSGCASGMMCLNFFASAEEHELIRKAGGFLALASTGLTLEGDTSVAANCMTLSLQLQAMFGIFPTLLFAYWREWSSRKEFLDMKMGLDKKIA